MITAAHVSVEQELASVCGVLNSSYARLVTLVAQALQTSRGRSPGSTPRSIWLTMDQVAVLARVCPDLAIGGRVEPQGTDVGAVVEQR